MFKYWFCRYGLRFKAHIDGHKHNIILKNKNLVEIKKDNEFWVGGGAIGYRYFDCNERTYS